MKAMFILAHDVARRRAIQAVIDAPEGYVVRISEPTRTLEQNSTQWPILEALSKQLPWPVNGQAIRMSPGEWKDVATAAFRREKLRMAMGLDGGMVMLGLRTSKFGKREFSEWIDFLYATAADRGVIVHPDEAP